MTVIKVKSKLLEKAIFFLFLLYLSIGNAFDAFSFLVHISLENSLCKHFCALTQGNYSETEKRSAI